MRVNFSLLGGLVIAFVYIMTSFLLSNYFNADYSYWIRVIWCGVVLFFIYYIIEFCNNSAKKQDNKTPLYVVFMIKAIFCGVISIGICIKSYFYNPQWMQVINILLQSGIVIYLILLIIGLININDVQKNDKHKMDVNKGYLFDLNITFDTASNFINSKNQNLFIKTRELFTESILVVNNNQHILKLNQIKGLLDGINNDNTIDEQKSILLQLINVINGFYR